MWVGRIELRDDAGALADAGAVTLTATQPDGSTIDLAVVRESVGVYTSSWTLNFVGRWVFRWVSSGSNADSYTDVADVADPADAPIVSMDELRRHMDWPKPPTTDLDRRRDEDGRRLASMATELVERHCGRVFRRRTVVESFPWPGAALMLTSLPVASVTSVVVDGVTLDPSAWRLGRAGIITRDYGCWGREVVVTYVAGDAVPPEPVRTAVLRLVEHHWQNARQAPHPLGGQATGYDEGQPAQGPQALPYSVASLLAGYVMPGFA